VLLNDFDIRLKKPTAIGFSVRVFLLPLRKTASSFFKLGEILCGEKTMFSYHNCTMQKSSLQTKLANPKPLQNKVSGNHNLEKDDYQAPIKQPIWLSHSTDIFKVVSAYTSLVGAVFLLAGGVSQDRFITAVGGISTAVGLIGTTVSGRKPNNHLDQGTDKPYKMPPEEPQDRLDTQGATVDCLENSEAPDSKTNLSQDTDSDTLMDSLEKLEQAILSDGRNR